MPTLAVRPALPKDEFLLRMQFRAQMAGYAEQFPNSCYHVVLLDSKPVGRLWVAPGDREFLLVDIGIHPNVQSKGLGTVLVQRLQQEAQRAKLPIRSQVERTNAGSLRFHRRLGFQVLREDLMQYYLEWRPAPLL